MMEHDDGAAKLAEAMLSFRRVRPDELPSGLFAETGWEIMLELFIADSRGRRMTGRQILSRSDAGAEGASRWLMFLDREGLVVGDGDGDLDDALTLSGLGLEQMERLLEKALHLRMHLFENG